MVLIDETISSHSVDDDNIILFVQLHGAWCEAYIGPQNIECFYLLFLFHINSYIFILKVITYLKHTFI